MKTEKIIINATWSANGKDVILSICDVQAQGDYKVIIQETEEKINIEVGEENWKEENEKACREIIINTLSEFEIINTKFSIL